MRIDHDIGLYPEHYAAVLRWYSLAFKDKHPTKSDEKIYHLFNVVYDDICREALEEKQEEMDNE